MDRTGADQQRSGVLGPYRGATRRQGIGHQGELRAHVLEVVGELDTVVWGVGRRVTWFARSEHVLEGNVMFFFIARRQGRHLCHVVYWCITFG